MKSRAFDPLRLDVERFATDNGVLEGTWPLHGMERLVDVCHADERPAADESVAWRAAGERRRQAAGESHAWLALRLDTTVKLTCQRCLGPLETQLRLDHWYHFVVGEVQAAQLDAESEEDVLASERALDLHRLAEDELLLALPLVPRHEVCPQPLLPPAEEVPDEVADAPNSFAALAALKRGVH